MAAKGWGISEEEEREEQERQAQEAQAQEARESARAEQEARAHENAQRAEARAQARTQANTPEQNSALLKAKRQYGQQPTKIPTANANDPYFQTYKDKQKWAQNDLQYQAGVEDAYNTVKHTHIGTIDLPQHPETEAERALREQDEYAAREGMMPGQKKEIKQGELYEIALEDFTSIEQFSHFVSTGATDEAKKKLIGEMASYSGLDEEFLESKVQEVLGADNPLYKDKSAELRQTNYEINQKLNSYGLMGADGSPINFNSADLNTVLRYVQLEPDQKRRNDILKTLEEATKTEGSRFYGKVFDKSQYSEFLGTADYDSQVWKDFSDDMNASFLPPNSYEDIEANQQAYDELMQTIDAMEPSPRMAAIYKRQVTEQYRKVTGMERGTEVPGYKDYLTWKEEYAEDLKSEEAQEKKPGFWERAGEAAKDTAGVVAGALGSAANAVGDAVSGLFGGKKEKTESPEAEEAQKKAQGGRGSSDGGSSGMRPKHPAPTPSPSPVPGVTFNGYVASAGTVTDVGYSPAPKMNEEDESAKQPTENEQAAIAQGSSEIQPVQAAETAAPVQESFGTVDKQDDLVGAMLMAKAGQGGQLNQKTAQKLDEHVKSDDRLRALYGLTGGGYQNQLFDYNEDGSISNFKNVTTVNDAMTRFSSDVLGGSFTRLMRDVDQMPDDLKHQAYQHAENLIANINGMERNPGSRISQIEDEQASMGEIPAGAGMDWYLTDNDGMPGMENDPDVLGILQCKEVDAQRRQAAKEAIDQASADKDAALENSRQAYKNGSATDEDLARLQEYMNTLNPDDADSDETAQYKIGIYDQMLTDAITNGSIIGDDYNWITRSVADLPENQDKETGYRFVSAAAIDTIREDSLWAKTLDMSLADYYAWSGKGTEEDIQARAIDRLNKANDNIDPEANKVVEEMYRGQGFGNILSDTGAVIGTGVAKGTESAVMTWFSGLYDFSQLSNSEEHAAYLTAKYYETGSIATADDRCKADLLQYIDEGHMTNPDVANAIKGYLEEGHSALALGIIMDNDFLNWVGDTKADIQENYDTIAQWQQENFTPLMGQVAGVTENVAYNAVNRGSSILLGSGFNVQGASWLGKTIGSFIGFTGYNVGSYEEGLKDYTSSHPESFSPKMANLYGTGKALSTYLANAGTDEALINVLSNASGATSLLTKLADHMGIMKTAEITNGTLRNIVAFGKEAISDAVIGEGIHDTFFENLYADVSYAALEQLSKETNGFKEMPTMSGIMRVNGRILNSVLPGIENAAQEVKDTFLSNVVNDLPFALLGGVKNAINVNAERNANIAEKTKQAKEKANLDTLQEIFEMADDPKIADQLDRAADEAQIQDYASDIMRTDKGEIRTDIQNATAARKQAKVHENELKATRERIGITSQEIERLQTAIDGGDTSPDTADQLIRMQEANAQATQAETEHEREMDDQRQKYEQAMASAYSKARDAAKKVISEKRAATAQRMLNLQDMISQATQVVTDTRKNLEAARGKMNDAVNAGDTEEAGRWAEEVANLERTEQSASDSLYFYQNGERKPVVSETDYRTQDIGNLLTVDASEVKSLDDLNALENALKNKLNDLGSKTRKGIKPRFDAVMKSLNARAEELRTIESAEADRQIGVQEEAQVPDLSQDPSASAEAKEATPENIRRMPTPKLQRLQQNLVERFKTANPSMKQKIANKVVEINHEMQERQVQTEEREAWEGMQRDADKRLESLKSAPIAVTEEEAQAIAEATGSSIEEVNGRYGVNLKQYVDDRAARKDRAVPLVNALRASGMEIENDADAASAFANFTEGYNQIQSELGSEGAMERASDNLIDAVDSGDSDRINEALEEMDAYDENPVETQKTGLIEGAEGAIGEEYQEAVSEAGQAITSPIIQKLTANLKKRYGIDLTVAPLAAGQQGYFDKNNNRLVLSRDLGEGELMRRITMHELTHFLEGTKGYEGLKNAILDAKYAGVQNRQVAMDADLKGIADAYTAAGIQNFNADNELIAQSVERILDGDEEFFNDLIGNGHKGLVARLYSGIKQFLARRQAKKDGTLEAYNRIRKAADAMKAALKNAAQTERTRQLKTKMANDPHPASVQFSIEQVAAASGFKLQRAEPGQYFTRQVEVNGEMRTITSPYQIVDKNGNVVDKITPEHMNDTPIGRMIDKAVKVGTINAETAKKQREMFADLATMCAQYDDHAMVWEIAGSNMFSALKNNSDPQYSNTVDFGTVCSKTQNIVDALSKAMLEEQRGLSHEEVLDVYNKLAGNKATVPCPVCYVFSRWMGVPSLLGRIDQYQDRFVGMPEAEVQKYIKETQGKYGPDEKSAKSEMAKKKTKLEKQIDQLTQQIESTALKNEKMRLAKELDKAMAEYKDIDAYNWVTQALCQEKNGTYKLDPKFKPTPKEILFDLNRTGEFATYEKNWKYRNTRGAGMGKAIMPYAGMQIGDIVKSRNGNAQLRWTEAQNPFFTGDDKKQKNALQNAIKRVKAQNLIGGQRFQSTSDFRPEWGLDYMMSFLEMQAAGAKGQLYTKVIEAVDMFATAGIEVNLSLMGKGKGYTEDANGNKTLVFSNVTGIDADKAFEKISKYDNVQGILVGLNDEHIRLAMADNRINFIIPWHSSGNSKDTLSSMLQSLSEKLDTSEARDYTDSQSDTKLAKPTKPTAPKTPGKKASADRLAEYDKQLAKYNADLSQYEKDVKQWEEDEASGKHEQQKTAWDARMKILTGKANKLTDAEKKVIDGNDYLKDLYRRFYEDSSEEETYHVKLSKSQAEHVFPYEYWDTSSTIENADVNGQRFAEYCDSIGLKPRFSEFKKDKGYWKLLIDRSMYNNDGTYHTVKKIDVTNVSINDVAMRVGEQKYGNKEVIDKSVKEAQEAWRRHLQAKVDDAKASTPAQQYSINMDMFAPQETETDTSTEYSASPRQFGNKTAQASEVIMDDVKNMLSGSEYEAETNDDQLYRASQKYLELGTDGAVNYLMNLDPGKFSADDNALMFIAIRDAQEAGDVTRQYQLAELFDRVGTEQGRQLQNRKLFLPSKLDGVQQLGEAGKKANEQNVKRGMKKDEVPSGREAPKEATENTSKHAKDVYQEAQKVYDRINQRSTGAINTQNRWGIPLNDFQMGLIRKYGLTKTDLRGWDYNRATLKERMLHAIVATPADTRGDDLLTLTQQLEFMKQGDAVVTEADMSYILAQASEALAKGITEEGAEPFTRESKVAMGRLFDAQANITGTSRLDKFNSWRYANMLSGTSTWSRNIMSNVLVAPLENLSTSFAEMVDKAVAKDTGNRTTARASKEAKKAARKEFADEISRTVRDYFVDKTDTSHGRKYNVGQGTGRTFQSKWLDTYETIVNFAMQIGDRPFYEHCYSEEMQVLNDLNTQIRDEETGEWRDMTSEERHEEATLRALERVFQEDNAIVTALNSARSTDKGIDFVMQTILPFTATPTNIAKRMLQYSPAGLAKALVYDGLYKGKTNGGADFDQRKFVMGVGRGLTGTGMIVAGALLAAAGILKPGRNDDEDKRTRDLRGVLGEAYGWHLDLFGQEREIDWALPSATGLLLGASLFNRMDNEETAGSMALGLVMDLGDELFENTFLSTINDMFRGYEDATGVMTRFIESSTESIMGQVMSPSFIRQIAKATDPYVRDTASQDTVWNALNANVIQNWPGLRQMLPIKTDIAGNQAVQTGYYHWGHETQNAAMDFLDYFISPTMTIGERNDQAVMELLDLSYRMDDSSFLPQALITSSAYKLNVTKSMATSMRLGKEPMTVMLSDDEKRQLNADYASLLFNGDGGRRYRSERGMPTKVDGLRSLMESPKWERMSDEKKADAVADLVKTSKSLILADFLRRKKEEGSL